MSDHHEEIVVNKFTEESAAKFRKQIISKAMQDPSQPIIIYIDSYGGYIDSLNSMLEDIEQIPNQIVTVCKGKAMSCGAVLLAAGDHRFCGRKSRVMVHQGSSAAWGPIESQQNDVDESKRLNKQLMMLLAKRCGMSLTQFKAEMKKRLIKGDDEARDMYLDANAAKDLGLVDYVGMPHIKPIVMYQIEPSPEKEYKSEEEVTKEALDAMGLTEKPKTKRKVTKKKVAKKKVSKKKTTKRK